MSHHSGITPGAAAAELRFQILERVSTLRLESNGSSPAAAKATPTAAGAAVSAAVLPDPNAPPSKTVGRPASLGDDLEMEDGKTTGHKNITTALKPSMTPRANFHLAPQDNTPKVSGMRTSLPETLLPNLTPLLPDEMEVNNRAHNTRLTREQKPAWNYRKESTIQGKWARPIVRTPPFPAPQGFIGREGVRTPAAPSQPTRCATVIHDSKIRARLSIPQFDSENGSDAAHPRKKARLSPPVRLAPRFCNPPSAESTSPQLPQDRTCPSDGIAHVNPVLVSVPKASRHSLSASTSSPLASISIRNPTYSMKTPLAKGGRKSLDAPFKHRTSSPGSRQARRQSLEENFGEVFDHQLTLLAMKPAERHRYLTKSKHSVLRRKSSDIIGNIYKQPGQSEADMETDDGYARCLTPVKFRLPEESTSAGYSNAKGGLGCLEDDSRDDYGSDEKLLTPVPTEFDDVDTYHQEVHNEETHAMKTLPEIPTCDDEKVGQRPLEDESPFAALEYDFFKP